MICFLKCDHFDANNHGLHKKSTVSYNDLEVYWNAAVKYYQIQLH